MNPSIQKRFGQNLKSTHLYLADGISPCSSPAGGLSCLKVSEPVDAAALTAGLSVLLGQLPDAACEQLLARAGQAVRSQAAAAPPLPADCCVLLALLELLAERRRLPERQLTRHVPLALLQLYRATWNGE